MEKDEQGNAFLTCLSSPSLCEGIRALWDLLGESRGAGAE